MAQQPAADRDAVLTAQRRVNLEVIRDNTKCATSYTQEYTRFTKFVDQEAELQTTEGRHLTRTNVDYYFTFVVAKRKGVRNTIRRAVSALQWYANKREYIGTGVAFSVESAEVEEALDSQKIYMESLEEGANDPHKGLKDILPMSEKLRIMRYVYQTCPDWGPASINFNWGQNGAVRGASNRKLKLSDLNISFGFGPEEFGPMSRAILVIMRKGKVHKDRHETDDQVCCWRHKYYELCAVFSTAMYVISRVKQIPDLNFLQPDRR